MLDRNTTAATSKYAVMTKSGTFAVTPDVGSNNAAINPPLTSALFTTTS